MGTRRAGRGVPREAYFVTLTAAYQRGDLSVVYPLARGMSPVIVMVAAIALLHEGPTRPAIVGIAAVAGGLVFGALLGIFVLGKQHGRERLAGAALILLGVALIAAASPA